jgi:arylsulfatase A-like enzyme
MTHIAKRACALSLCLAAALASLVASPANAAEKPHVVYIMADDLGWNDVGYHGGKIPTPNIDKLAAGGATLNFLYAQPYSTQSRAAFLTGRYPMRYGLQSRSIGPNARYGLPTDERTLAEALHETGYRTALIGKWQLGHAKQEWWPTRRGFDAFYGTLTGEIEPFLRKDSKVEWRRNDAPIKEEGYVTDLLAREAVKTIASHEGPAPLFLFVSLTAPAAPFGAPKDYLERVKDIADESRRQYAASVVGVDAAVGRIVDALDKRKWLENTLVVFHSDNGGALPMKFPTGDGDVKAAAADNGLLREGKGSTFDGGVRVVAVASMPGRIKPKTVVTGIVHVTDMYPTILALAGAKMEQPKKPDGMDIWPALAEGRPSPRTEVLLNVEDFGGAVRVGEWKLVARTTLPSKVLLFDVANDPEEKENKSEVYPDRVKELMSKLNEYSYDMTSSKYFEELFHDRPGDTPFNYGQNAPKR